MPTALPAPTPSAPAPAAPTPSAPAPPRRRIRRSAIALALLLALVALLGTGCVRVRAGMAVAPDDTVSGQIDVATPDGSPGGDGPPLQVPEDLSGDVEIARYEQDGYVGSRVTFDELTFDEVSRLLPQVSPTTTSAFSLQLRRAGDRVIVSGRADLTRVSADSADVALKIAFPGPVRQTDGTVQGDVVTWTFGAGAVGDVNAVVEYPDPDAPSWIGWAVLLMVIVLAAAAVVFHLAASARPQAEDRARR